MSSINNQAYQKLLQTMETRKRSGKFPKRFKFDKPGDAILGEVVDIAENPFKPEAQQVHVRSIKTGEEYTLPSNVTLNRLLLEQGNVKVGDYVFARYVGQAEEAAKNGFKPKIYEAAILSAIEAKQILASVTLPDEQAEPEPLPAQEVTQPQEPSILIPEPTPPTIPRAREVTSQSQSVSQATSNTRTDVTKGTEVSANKTESNQPVQGVPVTQAPATNQTTPTPQTTQTSSKQQDPRLVEFVNAMMGFYGKVSKDTLMRLVTEVQGFKVTLEDVLQAGNLQLNTATGEITKKA